MKKFYTLALATAVALSASAGTDLKLRGNADFSNKALTLKADKAQGLTMLKKQTSALSAVSPSLKAKKAASAADIAGEYTITFGDYYFETSTGEFEDDCTVTVEDGFVAFEPTQVMPFGGVLDEDNASITFTNINLGLVDFGSAGSYYLRVEPFIYDWDQKDMIPQDFTATYSNGAISFPTDAGMSWAAYEDANYTQFFAYADIEDLLSCVKNVDEDDTAWTSLGNATLMDGWVLPLFGLDQTDPEFQWEVELQQNDDNANLYRLVDPYHGNCPVAAENQATKAGYITFDVSNPEHVVFSFTESGFALADVGLSKMYCGDILSAYMGYLGTDDPELTIQILEEAEVTVPPASTFKNGVVELASVFENDVNGYTNAACFGIQGDQFGFYSWQDENGVSANMLTRITFPETGIDSVFAGESDAPVKFFNLQGIEVSKPAAGQVVIRKQGDKATKFLAR